MNKIRVMKFQEDKLVDMAQNILEYHREKLNHTEVSNEWLNGLVEGMAEIIASIGTAIDNQPKSVGDLSEKIWPNLY